MLLEVVQNDEVVDEFGDLEAEHVDGAGITVEAIEIALCAQLFAGSGDLLAVVKELDGLLKAYGDAEANDDSGNVDEEVAPGVDGFVRGVDVKHWGGLLRHGRRFVCGD
jgi:hypothetical protein